MDSRCLSCLAIALLLSPGCADGPKRAPISGIVRVDGKLLERGVINFIPTEGTFGPGAGGVIENGEYELGDSDGPLIGMNRVQITGFRKTGKKMAIMGSEIDEEIQVVPKEFNENPKNIVTIKTGPNTADFDIPIPRQ